MRFLAILIVVVGTALPAQHVHTNRGDAKRLPLPKEDGVWHFVVFGDRTGGPAEGIKVLAQGVEDTNLLDPDLVMTVGDLINGYNETPQWMKQMREFHGVMEKLRMPWFPVAGNHDTFWRGKKNGEAKPQNEHDDHYERHFGPLWYWFEHKNAAFVVLYTDETIAGTNEKNYHKPGGQRMSAEQRSWLQETLKRTKKFEHCFVFLHHPRWIAARYPSSDWSEIEALLQDSGNVTGVFAGHIHRMHFAEAAARPGGRPLPYYTLATTGGNVAAVQLGTEGYDHDASQAGYMHHLNVVSVRKGRISVSAIPIGAVIDPRTMTDEFNTAIAAVRRRPSSYRGDAVVLRSDGTARGTVRFALENPTLQPIAYTLTPDPKSSRVAFWPDHVHLTVPPNGKREVAFRYARGRRGLGPFPAPTFLEEAEWLGKGLRIAAPNREMTVAITLPKALPVADATNGVLNLDGKGNLRIPSQAASPPDGPLTLEAWVWAESLKGRRPLVNKTENAEYGIFMDDGTARFMVHLDGRYAVASMPAGRTLTERHWHHVAGVFDGKAVKLFVDGRPVAEAPATGRRTRNELPLLVGADPDKNGRPVDRLRGRIDDVRLSCVARYDRAFTPTRRARSDQSTLLLLHLDGDIGPLTPDASGRGRHASLRGSAWCGEPLVPPER